MSEFNQFANCPGDHGAIAAFHPGPDFLKPVVPAVLETPSQRLLRLEGEVLEMAVERGLERRGGRFSDLAVSIIALRAQVRG